MRRAWVLMGVAGCGKSTVAPRLCAALASTFGERSLPPPVFIEGDDHHPPSNIAKMSRGEPLTDEDRQPWLDALAERMREASTVGGGSDVVLACSALKRAHRATLVAGAVAGGGADRAEEEEGTLLKEVRFLHLVVSREQLKKRLERRAAAEGHFFAPALLQSQLDALEVGVVEDPRVVSIEADCDVEHVVAAATGAARRVMATTSSPPRAALDPTTLETTVGTFLDGWWERLRAMGLHEELLREGRQIDHVCWRCATAQEHDDAVRALSAPGVGSVAGSSMVGGRVITTVELSTPVRWRDWLVPAIEVPMPKRGRPKPSGFEHAEVALMTGGVRGSEALETLKKKKKTHQVRGGGLSSATVPWDDKGMGKDINPELSVDLGGGCCVKFHNRPLLEVVAYEIALGIATGDER